jgi:hypothetical protein
MVYSYIGPVYEKMSGRDLFVFFYPKLFISIVEILGVALIIKGKHKIGLIFILIPHVLTTSISPFSFNIYLFLMQFYDIIVIFLFFIINNKPRVS